MRNIYEYRLWQEKKKLNQMIDEAFRNGALILQDKVLEEQSRRVDRLVVMVQQKKQRKTKLLLYNHMGICF